MDNLKIKNIIQRKFIIILFIIILSFISIALTSYYPLLSGEIINNLSSKKDSSFDIYNVIFKVIILLLFQLFIYFIYSFSISYWIQDTTFRLRNIILNRSLNIKSGIIKSNSFSTILISDTENISQKINSIIQTMLSSTLSIVVYGTISFFINKKLTLILFLLIPILFISNYKMSNLIKKYYYEIQSSLDNLIVFISRIISGIDFIHVYKMIPIVNSRYTKINKTLKTKNMKMETLISFMQTLTSLINSIIPIFMLVLGSNMVYKNEISVGSLISFYSYVGLIIPSITGLVNIMPLFNQVNASMDRINSMFIKNRLDNNLMYKNLTTNNSKSEISIKSLSLKYESKNIFGDFNLEFNEKRRVYIVSGKNGIGKSKLFRMISGLDAGNNGTVIFKNVKNFFYIPTDLFLFYGTIKDNIMMGIDDKNYALSIINKVFEFDKSLLSENFNLETVVKNKNQLSYGQIQKIKLIKALASNPDALVIDELLSNIDHDVKYKYIDFIISIKNIKILIFIDHNLDLKNVEKINFNDLKLVN